MSFDHRAASAAAEACRRAAGLVDAGGEVSADAAVEAVAAWAGRYREEFDGDLRGLQGLRADVAASLRSYAEVIESAAVEARVEQRGREDLREQWYEESRRLERRAAAQRATGS